MKVAIMQPYFFPYIGYFQLINAVDVFVLYDEIEFTKKGWINRNRILMNNKDCVFTLPLKKDSDFLNINQRVLADDWYVEKIKLLNKIKEAYRKAPFYNEVITLFEDVINYENKNLFSFIKNSLLKTLEYLQITTKIVLSSEIDFDKSLKSQEKVIAICNALQTSSYLNPIGGVELYNKVQFNKNGIALNFIKSKPIHYRQFDNDFITWLSIIDVMMFNSSEEIKQMLNQYELV